MTEADICVIVTDDGDILSLEIEVCASAFSRPAAQRILQTFHHILTLVLNGDAGQTVASVDPLTQQDLSQIREWNSKTPICRQTCLHAVIEEQARRRPLAPAVCSWDGNLAYVELQALSTKLAHMLSRLGVGPEILVPCAFEKSKYAVVATLAVLKAGGAFVPLDASHPRERLKSIICRVDAKLLLASAKTAPAFDSLVPTILIVDRALLDTLPEEEENPESTVDPSNSAFVLFTSGSTGEPKGLVQEHASVCTINEAYGESIFINQESRVLNFAAFTFDASTVDVFTTLHHGGCVCIPSEEHRLNDIAGAINAFHANWVNLTPSFALASVPHPSEIPTVQLLVLAGEEVKKEHVQHFVGRINRVVNCYGPAEAGGVLVNVYHSTASEPSTVGRAMSSANSWIVDPSNPRRLAPIGAIGELVVEGHTLARGYLKQPDKTNAAFFRHPGWHSDDGHSPQPRRFYRTGDLVKIKIRGQRVELTEIEQHLAIDKRLKRAMVECPRSGIYAKRLVVVAEPCNGTLHHSEEPQTTPGIKLLSPKVLRESGFSIHESAKSLAERTPTYMMPAAWLMVANLPLTDSQKIHRRRVRDWLEDLPVTQSLLLPDVSSAPLLPLNNPLALDISHKVSELSGNGNGHVFRALNGRNLDLKTAGIDSIQVMTLSRWLRDKYGLRIAVDTLSRPGVTVDELSRMIMTCQSGQDAGKLQAPQLDIREEARLLFNTLRRSSARIAENHVTAAQSASTVFLTGATGFLGTEILHQLLCDEKIRKVFVHVRAANTQEGRERIIAAAKKALWWSESFNRRIEVWPGDLASAKLGLNRKQWDRLTGSCSAGESIDAVIHNGASVKWNLAYDCLRDSNTMSTVQLLQAMAERQFGGRFVYVSGGQGLSTDCDEDECCTPTAHGTPLTGYAQTKMVSELVVKQFAQCPEGQPHSARVVKPGYIIGDARRGKANPNDYLWGITKSALELGSYNREELNGWLFVSDVATVARAVCAACHTKGPKPGVVKVLDGLFMRDFWDLLTGRFGYKLEAVDADEWWRLLSSRVEQQGHQHCLWALQDVLEAGRGAMSSTATVPTTAMMKTCPDVLGAIKSNVQYLKDEIGFFPSASARSEKVEVLQSIIKSCWARARAMASFR
ncbi:hypothetical protein UVI_02050960 [Ustilaginoidea virens]|uniref:Carrier domain-containing protein n=1 Tax=Ustilaginoidea virens TaxID=1159556 RepID=A0A1B5L2C8_USTVR|nr:hypothetical protein UVI_02050960 [Ustilaginoidea virens]